MIRYKGASYSPGDLTPGKNGIKCHVMLLDGKRDTVELNKKALAGALFDYICRRLDILEREYFGIQYEDEKKLTRWLDFSKPLKKQLKKKENRLHFRVKFYAIDPSVLQDNTRYQFFLQLKNDIASERLICLPNITATVLAYIIQAEVGDYDRSIHHIGYVTEFKLLPVMPKMMEEDVAKAHVALIGTAPEDAEIQFLQKVKWLDRYGVHLFEVHGEERVKYYLGMGPPGLSVFRDTTRVSYYVWSKIVKVSYRRKRFIVFVRGGAKELTDSQVASFAFEVGSSKTAKYIWKCCVDNIAFYTSDEKVDHSVPKSRSARFVRTSSGRYIRKSSKVDVSAMASGRGGVEKSNVNSGAHMSPSKAQQRNPPLPPRHDVSKQAKKKGSKDDGDNFDEEPLFPKYENIFHFAPKEKKTSPPSGSSVPEGKPPLQSSSVPAAGGKTNADLDTSAPAYRDEVHRLSSVVELAEEELSDRDDDDEDDDDEDDDNRERHKRDYDTDDELSQSSSDSDDEDEPANLRPHHMQGNQPHPLANQQQQNVHMIYSDEDIDGNLNAIEDEKQMEPSDLAWNSNLMYDRLEPIDDEKPVAAEEQPAAPSNSAILTQIKPRFISVESGGSKVKSPEHTKPVQLHNTSTPPPPPPPPKIPCGQFVAPPYPPQVVATDPDSAADGLNERAIDCGNDQVVRRTHPKEPPKPETVATRNALMAWMMEQQSKEKMLNTQSPPRTATLPNYHKSSAPNFTQASLPGQPPVPQSKPPPVSNKPPPVSNKPPPVSSKPPPVSNKPPPVSNKPSHFTVPPEWKSPSVPAVAQKVPPPKAPKPVTKPPVMPPVSNANQSDTLEKPSPSHKSPAKPDTGNDLGHTDSSSSLDAGGQVSRGKSRLPPGLDIAVLTRINPELDYNAQDYAHKDSIDRRKKDQEASRPAVPMFLPDTSDTAKEFIPPGGSHTDLIQQTSMEEEKDKIMAYIKNRKVENKISGDNADTFMPVPAEVEAKHQKKHQEKQIRKSLRNKLKRVMPNGREKRDRDGDMHNQWSRDLPPPISSADINSLSRLPPTSRETVNSTMSSLPPSNEDSKIREIVPPNRDRSNSDAATTTTFSSGEIRGSGVGMEMEQSISVLSSQQQYKDTSPATTTVTTSSTVAAAIASIVDQPPVSVHQQQQRELHSSTNRTMPPQTAPKPSPPIAPKPSVPQKPALKPHPFAAKKPSPPIAPKPPRDQQLKSSNREPLPAEQARMGESQKLIEQPHPPVSMHLQALATCGDDTMSSSGSSQPSYSPQPPSETSAPPPYSSPSGAPDRMISPDNAINSLLDENLPKGGKKDAERIPFPGGGPATHGNTKLPRYSQIEVLSPIGNGSVENPPAYPGNSAEFVQPPAPNSALQTMLDGLPPPPPHLAALTGTGQDSTDGKEQQSQPQQQDGGHLTTMDIQQELHTRTGSDLSDLPPAIASFMNRVRQNSAGSMLEMRPDQRPPDQQSRPSAFSLAHANTAVDQHQQSSHLWQQQHSHEQRQQHQQQFHQRQDQQRIQQQLQEHHQQQQQYHHQLQDQYHLQHQQHHLQNQQSQPPRPSLPSESFISEVHAQLRNMPPDGSSTKSSLQENKDLSSPPDLSDSSSQMSSEESEERRETNSSISYGSLPRPICHHHPTGGPMHLNPPRSYMQQQPSYPHSLPPSMSTASSYAGRMDHGFIHTVGRHTPSSVISAHSAASGFQQHSGHPAHMFNQLAERPHMDRQLLERQQMDRLQAIERQNERQHMDRLQAMERQKQMERPVPISRANPMEFDRQFQCNQQPPPVPPGTQRPQPLYPRGNQDWSPNVNAGRQRSYSSQQENDILKKRQMEAQHRLMLQENSRRAHMMPPQGVYHADSLQHLHMLPSHSSANDASWSPRHQYNYHSIDHTHDHPHMGHVGPYLHQSGGRHSYSATPSAREILGPPQSIYPHQQHFQQRGRVPHHSGYSQQPPPPNHEQSDKKNFSVIQV